MMDKARWHDIQALFDRAVTLAPEEQDELLDEIEDDDLRHEVRQLLAADGRADQHVEDALRQVLRQPIDEPETKLPIHIGPYRLLRRLGRGGQGTVYLAQRTDEDLEGKVAVKLLRPSIHSEELSARFRQERRILSGLTHPNIARFLDAGTSETGHPYLVMEAVDGLPIDEHCRQHDLSLRERLELFCRAAQAVQAAHRRLVIHRDIKPSNLLVTADGTPKLLDFGIAKLLEPERALASTTPGTRHLTPETASPEQIRGETLTTATDVYGLGGLLYRLLTERAPYAFRDRSQREVERVICLVDPTPPSVATDRRALRGDLDAIVLRALAKDPSQRYGSVEQMVEDIQRHLGGLPIEAHRPSLVYRTGKFLSRNRVPLTIAATLLATVVSLTSYAALRISRERDRALTALGFVEGVVGHLDPNRSKGSDQTPRGLLDAAVPELEAFADQPHTQARLQTLLASLYQVLGHHPEARDLLTHALVNLERTPGGAVTESARIHHLLGRLALEQGRLGDAERHFDDALTKRKALHGDRHWTVADTLQGLAEVAWHRRDIDQAASLVRTALALRRTLLPVGPPSESQALDLASTLDLFAVTQRDHGAFAAAERTWHEALGLLTRTVGREHLAVTRLLNNLSANLRSQRRWDEAEAMLRELIGIEHQLLGPEHLSLGISYMVLGNLHRRQERFDEAIGACETALRITRARGGDLHVNLSPIWRCIGRAQEAQGLPEAEASYRESLRLRRLQQQAGTLEDPWSISLPLYRLGTFLAKHDRHREAEPFLQECFDIRRTLAPESAATRRAACALGASARALGHDQPARTWLSTCDA